jgi:hypothetical protein
MTMMLRAFLLLVGLLTAGSASASCHRYAIWKYPYPQHCESRAELLHPDKPDFPLPPFRPTFARVLISFFDMDKATTIQPEWADWAGRLYYVGGPARPQAGE